jgi:hypothetical protein
VPSDSRLFTAGMLLLALVIVGLVVLWTVRQTPTRARILAPAPLPGSEPAGVDASLDQPSAAATRTFEPAGADAVFAPPR